MLHAMGAKLVLNIMDDAVTSGEAAAQRKAGVLLMCWDLQLDNLLTKDDELLTSSDTFGDSHG